MCICKFVRGDSWELIIILCNKKHQKLGFHKHTSSAVSPKSCLSNGRKNKTH